MTPAGELQGGSRRVNAGSIGDVTPAARQTSRPDFPPSGNRRKSPGHGGVSDGPEGVCGRQGSRLGREACSEYPSSGVDGNLTGLRHERVLPGRDRAAGDDSGRSPDLPLQDLNVGTRGSRRPGRGSMLQRSPDVAARHVPELLLEAPAAAGQFPQLGNSRAGLAAQALAVSAEVSRVRSSVTPSSFSFSPQVTTSPATLMAQSVASLGAWESTSTCVFSRLPGLDRLHVVGSVGCPALAGRLAVSVESRRGSQTVRMCPLRGAPGGLHPAALRRQVKLATSPLQVNGEILKSFSFGGCVSVRRNSFRIITSYALHDDLGASFYQ